MFVPQCHDPSVGDRGHHPLRHGPQAVRLGGIIPSMRKSDRTLHHGHITRAGPAAVRHVLAEAAQTAIRKEPYHSDFLATKRRRGSGIALIRITLTTSRVPLRTARPRGRAAPMFVRLVKSAGRVRGILAARPRRRYSSETARLAHLTSWVVRSPHFIQASRRYATARGRRLRARNHRKTAPRLQAREPPDRRGTGEAARGPQDHIDVLAAGVDSEHADAGAVGDGRRQHPHLHLDGHRRPGQPTIGTTSTPSPGPTCPMGPRSARPAALAEGRNVRWRRKRSSPARRPRRPRRVRTGRLWPSTAPTRVTLVRTHRLLGERRGSTRRPRRRSRS